MVRVSLFSPFAASALAYVAKRFTVGSQPVGTVDPGVAADCTTWVTVQNGDTCDAIVSYFDITQAQFVSYNPSLNSDCSGLTPGHSYCTVQNDGDGPPSGTTSSSPTATTSTAPTNTIPSPTQSGLASNCNNFYNVQAGDTCQGIVNQYGTFSLSSFYSWNPAVGNSCQGLQAGYYVCVGVPGTPTTVPSTTTPPSSGPQPEQTGIVSDCNKYYLVNAGDTCQAIVNDYGSFTLQQFYSWNPAVGSSCQSLQTDYYVCVGVKSSSTKRPTTTTSSHGSTGPTPTQSGIVSDCTKYYQAVSGDSCSSIVAKFGTFTLAQFEQWNPAVGSACSNLLAGDYYCIAIPGTPTKPISSATPTSTHGPQPQESGTASNCKEYHDVVSGDTCVSIEKQYKISASDFQKWNKNVGSDCKNLWLGYYVCVSA